MTTHNTIRDTVYNFTDFIHDKRGAAYACGYIQSFLVGVIDRHVPYDKRQEVIDDIEYHKTKLIEKYEDEDNAGEN